MNYRVLVLLTAATTFLPPCYGQGPLNDAILDAAASAFRYPRGRLQLKGMPQNEEFKETLNNAKTLFSS
jgi:hypothetical protein